jgi:hypothetical protein
MPHLKTEIYFFLHACRTQFPTLSDEHGLRMFEKIAPKGVMSHQKHAELRHIRSIKQNEKLS